MRSGSAAAVTERALARDEQMYVASQWRLMWLRLRRHRLAIVGAALLAVFYLGALCAELIAPYSQSHRFSELPNAPPQRLRWVRPDGLRLRPFVYGVSQQVNPVTWRREYSIEPSQIYPVYLFVRGDRYRLWGLVSADIHLFGTREGTVFLLGSDGLGRDLLSRIIYGARISLSIGLVGVAMSFLLGLSIGGVSGYFGGALDDLVQRIIEFIRSLPVLPLWMALAAALPAHWPPLQVYFGITIILSAVGWTGLARVTRGKILSLRNDDFVVAAAVAGASDLQIIARHLIPSFLSYIIVALTLAVPQMILAETALSFLGIGLRAPVVSWGVLLKDAQNIHAVALAPWLLVPGLFVIVVVLAFNFVGDGLRDAADPYTQ